MQITLNLRRLEEYARGVRGRPGELHTLRVSKLKGGYAAARVYRVDLEYRSTEGGSETIPVVQKYAGESEVHTMQALCEVPAAGAVPRLIDCARSKPASEEESVAWFVTPLYEGDHLTFEDEVPLTAIESLARVHAYFAPRIGQLDWLPSLDVEAFYRTFDRGLEALEAAQDRQPNALLARAYGQLNAVRESPVLLGALEKLPVTLTHGDVHPWNIIRLPDERSILIDWGGARIAPAMLDLANLVEIDSPNWEAYLSIWECASGEALDTGLARLGYHWATVMVNLQYLPFRAGQWPGNEEAPVGALDMVGRLRQAIENIRESSLL